MFVIARTLIALLAFCIRFFVKPNRFMPHFEFDGQPFQLAKSKQSVGILTPFKSRILFSISAEKPMHRFFKKLGISSELSAGDAAFDQRLYVASDHPSLAEALRGNARLRELILEAFNKGFTHIRSNSQTLSLAAAGGMSEIQAQEHASLLATLKHELEIAEQSASWRARDPYAWRIVLIESLLWSIFAFAVGGIFEGALWSRGDHLWDGAILLHGLRYAGPAFVLLMAAAVLFMRGSSRGGRIFLESVGLLGFSLPLIAFQLLADINQKHDKSPAVFYEFPIQGRQVRESRSKSGTSRTYLVHIKNRPVKAPADRPVEPSLIPTSIRVDRDLYQSAGRGDILSLGIKRGRLGFPYFTSKSVRKGPHTPLE